jgi:hypothetical protein
MQKKDILRFISEAIEDDKIDTAVVFWNVSYSYISPQEFVKACEEGGWCRDTLLEILKTQRFMYDQAVSDVEKTYYYSEENK